MKATLATTALFCVGAANAFFAPTAFTGQQLTAGTSAPSRTTTGVTMKIFDWKRRESEDGLVLDRVAVDTLKPAPGSRQRHKRKGRGIAAGQGHHVVSVCEGKSLAPALECEQVFEGGQQPLYRRLPKLVGRPMGPGHTKKQFNLIKLDALNGLDEGATVNFESLRAAGKVTKTKHRWHKVVGGMELETTGLTVQAHGFTKSAVEAIEAKGGKCQLLSPTTNEVLSMDEEEEE